MGTRSRTWIALSLICLKSSFDKILISLILASDPWTQLLVYSILLVSIGDCDDQLFPILAAAVNFMVGSIYKLCSMSFGYGRAVTTIEADEAAASSDFLQKKWKRKRERKKEKEQKTVYRFLLFLRVYSVCVAFPDLFLCSMYDTFRTHFCVQCMMLFRTYFCVWCMMLFQIYFCSQSDFGSFITDFPPY